LPISQIIRKELKFRIRGSHQNTYKNELYRTAYFLLQIIMPNRILLINRIIIIKDRELSEEDLKMDSI
jgi:hypothetical protein